MRSMVQLKTRYQRYETADKALRTFLVSWQKEHGVTFEEVAEMLEMAQADAETGNLEHREGSLEDILS
jgi:DNA-binding transcriptional MerR regulator